MADPLDFETNGHSNGRIPSFNELEYGIVSAGAEKAREVNEQAFPIYFLVPYENNYVKYKLNYEEIDGTRATQLLEQVDTSSRRGSNRSMRASHCAKIERALGHEKWKAIFDALKFDSDGLLIDGFHRLTAIKNSNATVTMPCLYGFPLEYFQFMDQGTPRTGADSLEVLKGVKNAADVANTVKLLFKITESLAGDIGWARAPDLQNWETVDIFNRHPRLEEIVKEVKQTAKDLKVSVNVFALLCYIYAETDKDKYTSFLGGLAIKDNTRELGDPRHKLSYILPELYNSAILQDPPLVRHMRDLQSLCAIQYAWDKFCANENVTEIEIMTKKTDLFKAVKQKVTSLNDATKPEWANV